MLKARRALAVMLLSLTGPAAAQTRDQIAAQHVLGPHWKQMSRSAGAVFAGTVLAVERGSTPGRALPVVQVRFRVDRPIVGARMGQLFTLREWAGAWDIQRPMQRGQRLLLLLYPPSPAGLSSPIGGASGQIPLDHDGKITAGYRARASGARQVRASRTDITTRISLLQLERAILGARHERN